MSKEGEEAGWRLVRDITGGDESGVTELLLEACTAMEGIGLQKQCFMLECLSYTVLMA